MEQSYKKLEAARDSKEHQIKQFFNDSISDIKVMAESKNVKELYDDLVFVHNALGVKPHEKYPVEDVMAKEKKAEHEAFFQAYAKEYGYYDIFIICAAHGHVMYTQAKESDYGENLSSGPLKDSGLADVWRKVKELKRPVFTDMKPYAPSNNNPSMFLGTPMYKDGALKAVVVFQVSEAMINNIAQFREGYGDTQEAYLVGQDNLMRTDSYLSPENYSVKASYKNPSTGTCDTEATKNALAGKTESRLIIDYNGNPVLSSYTPLKVGEDLHWALLSEIDEAEVNIASNEIRNALLLDSFLILVVVLFVAFIIVSSSIIKPLNMFKHKLVDISKNYDLTQKIDTNAPKEIAEMAISFNALLHSLQELVSTSKDSSVENATIAQELSATAVGVGQNVENSVSIVENTTSQARLMQNEITASITDAQESKKEILLANENLEIARDEIITLTNNVEATAQKEEELAQNMETLSREANEVKTVLTVISDIADQTNLLALNAAIEAARAGEHGRGFAVVADEVRKLAERTQKTLSEINATISVVVQSIGDASTQMSINSQEIQNLAGIAQEVEAKINTTVSIVNNVVVVTDKTVNDFEKTGQDIDQIVHKIEDINTLSSTNARSVEEIVYASEHLNTMTEELNSKLATFRT
ncbi:methyl-accepting chemotaxis protein [Sulfurimonas sp. SAG-AH-194-I05]|nr:methyl-accepting chemotaxis protein [Sulfurimonas sp. SAG-AH-194-I05]